MACRKVTITNCYASKLGWRQARIPVVLRNVQPETVCGRMRPRKTTALYPTQGYYPEIEGLHSSRLAAPLEAQLSVAGERQPAKAAQMIGIGAAEIRVFLFLLRSTLGLVATTVTLYGLHLRTATRILGGIALAFIVVTTWAYLSIWYVG